MLSQNVKGYLSLISAIIIMLLIGNLFAFPNLVPYFQSYLYYEYGNQEKISLIKLYFVAPIGICVHNIFPTFTGLIDKLVGIRILIFLATISLCSSGLILYFSIQYYLILFSHFLYGLGASLTYYTSLRNCWKYFPNRKDLLSGILFSSFALSSFIFTSLADLIINPDNTPKEGKYYSREIAYRFLKYIKVFMICVGVIGTISTALCFPYPEEIKTNNNNNNENNENNNNNNNNNLNLNDSNSSTSFIKPNEVLNDSNISNSLIKLNENLNDSDIQKININENLIQNDNFTTRTQRCDKFKKRSKTSDNFTTRSKISNNFTKRSKTSDNFSTRPKISIWTIFNDPIPLKKMIFSLELSKCLAINACTLTFGFLLSNTYRSFGIESNLDEGGMHALSKVFTAINTVSRILWGLICQKFKFKKPYYIIVLTQIAVGSSLYYSAKNLYIYFIVVCLGALSYSGHIVFFPNLIYNKFGVDNSVILLGICGIFSGIAVLIGPILTYFVNDLEDYFMIYILAVSPSIVSLILTIFIKLDKFSIKRKIVDIKEEENINDKLIDTKE